MYTYVMEMDERNENSHLKTIVKTGKNNEVTIPRPRR